MIPTVEDIVVGLACGSMASDRARHWLYEHIRLAEDRGDLSDLRDCFAAKAMAAYCSSDNWRSNMNHAETASVAYHMADAMLKARAA